MKSFDKNDDSIGAAPAFLRHAPDAKPKPVKEKKFKSLEERAIDTLVRSGMTRRAAMCSLNDTKRQMGIEVPPGFHDFGNGLDADVFDGLQCGYNITDHKAQGFTEANVVVTAEAVERVDRNLYPFQRESIERMEKMISEQLGIKPLMQQKVGRTFRPGVTPVQMIDLVVEYGGEDVVTVRKLEPNQERRSLGEQYREHMAAAAKQRTDLAIGANAEPIEDWHVKGWR